MEKDSRTNTKGNTVHTLTDSRIHTIPAPLTTAQCEISLQIFRSQKTLFAGMTKQESCNLLLPT